MLLFDRSISQSIFLFLKKEFYSSTGNYVFPNFHTIHSTRKLLCFSKSLCINTPICSSIFAYCWPVISVNRKNKTGCLYLCRFTNSRCSIPFMANVRLNWKKWKTASVPEKKGKNRSCARRSEVIDLSSLCVLVKNIFQKTKKYHHNDISTLWYIKSLSKKKVFKRYFHQNRKCEVPPKYWNNNLIF